MYDSPYNWLLYHIEEIYNEAELRWFIQQLASKLDADQIQDLFQDIMIEDGYFDDEDAAEDGEEDEEVWEDDWEDGYFDDEDAADDEEEEEEFWPDEDEYLAGEEE